MERDFRMIDKDKILPFNFFNYGGIYSGEHGGMRYIIKRGGEKPDYVFAAAVWPKPYSYDNTDKADITEETFEFSDAGREAAIEWIGSQYEDKINMWESAPSIVAAPIDLNKTYQSDE